LRRWASQAEGVANTLFLSKTEIHNRAKIKHFKEVSGTY
jgi:hypothetical protein